VKKVSWLAALGFVVMVQAAFAQVDVAVGLSTTAAPSANSATGSYAPQSLTGGAYPSASVDFMLKRNFGVNGEIAWKASRGNYLNTTQPFRPVLWDFNGIWAPQINKFVVPELMAGIGAESTRFYNIPNCGSTGCTNYTSSNHFLAHFGGGVRLYAKGNFFVRPEAHLYLVNNNIDFSSARLGRYGVSIGYTFGGRK
jgi:hypothetical protein